MVPENAQAERRAEEKILETDMMAIEERHSFWLRQWTIFMGSSLKRLEKRLAHIGDV